MAAPRAAAPRAAAAHKLRARRAPRQLQRSEERIVVERGVGGGATRLLPPAARVGARRPAALGILAQLIDLHLG